MEMYIENGLDRKDCELKIAEKYKRPFHIVTQKAIRIGGFLGLFSKPGVEVQFYFTPLYQKNPAINTTANMPFPWYAHDTEAKSKQYSQPNVEEEKKKVYGRHRKKL